MLGIGRGGELWGQEEESSRQRLEEGGGEESGEFLEEDLLGGTAGNDLSNSLSNASGERGLFVGGSENPLVIEEIEVRGNTGIGAEEIKGLLLFAEGETYDLEKIRRSFRSLYASDHFEKIEFFVELLESSEEEMDKVRLIVEVEEYPFIRSIGYSGARHFRYRSLRSSIKLTRNAKYQENDVQQARDMLIEKYQEAGFNSISITYKVELNEDLGGVEIVFFIKEGSRIIVDAVVFKGNTVVSARSLRKVMETKKNSLIRSGVFEAEVYEADKEKILYAFKSRGYVDVKFVETNLTYRWSDPRKKETQLMTIEMEIEEGEVYYFGTTRVQGNTIFSEENFKRFFLRVEGERFDESKHEADIAIIYESYQSQGYVFSRVTPIAQTNEDRSIDYVLDIYEGRKAHVENIFIEGLIKTKEYVIERELLLKEGEIFSVAELRASLLNLNRLGYFSEINPDYAPASAEGLMNIILDFGEQQTGKIAGGISYSTLYGFGLTFSLEESNFLGRAQKFSVAIEYALLAKRISVSFTEPWIGGRPIALGGAMSFSKYYTNYYVNRAVTDADGMLRTNIVLPGGGAPDLVQSSLDAIRYTEDIFTLSVFSQQNVKSWFNVSENFSINYTREYLQSYRIFPEAYVQTEVYELNKDLFDPTPPINESNLYYVLSSSITRDYRNSTLNPTRGTLTRLSAFLFIGAYRLIKWHFDLAAYIPVLSVPKTVIGGSPWHLILSYRGRFRTLGNLFNGDLVYPQRFYYQLYRTELRGWDYIQIYDFRKERYGENVLFNGLPFGQALVEHEFELRVGLPIDIFQAIGFFEFANLNYNILGPNQKGAAFLYDFKNYMYGVGFGFRLNLPVLPIRFYWGWRYHITDNGFEVFAPSTSAFLGIPGTHAPTFVLDFQVSF